MEKLQNLLSARCTQVEKLQRSLNDQTEILASLKERVRSLTTELDSVTTEHKQCERKDNSARNLQEQKVDLGSPSYRKLEERLEKEMKEKDELANTVKEMRGILEQEKKCVERKKEELAEMKTLLQLTDKENEESSKDKETKLVELTFAYEDLRKNLDNMEKNFEDKCKELRQVKEQLKQTEEGSEEMKEDYDRELDRVKFELRDAINDCNLLREENKDLQQKTAASSDHFACVREKKKLLHQLEEAKLRSNQAKHAQEKIQNELIQANLKVISFEGRGNWTSSDETEQFKTQVSELDSEVQKWETRADEKNSSCGTNACKDEEMNNLRSEVCKLQAEVKEWKTVADEKKENAQKSLATSLKLVNKLEMLSRDKNAASPCSDTAGAGESSDGSSSFKPFRVNLLKADTSLTPLAKSLSNLDIESTTAVTSQAAPAEETISDTKKRARTGVCCIGTEQCKYISNREDLTLRVANIPEIYWFCFIGPYVRRRVIFSTISSILFWL